jgi:hypothetical protein
VRAFGVCLLSLATSTSTSIGSVTTSGSLNESENGTTTSSQTVRVPAPEISTSWATLTVAHDNLGPSTWTGTGTEISTWTETSILSPYPYACVLYSCEHGMPCVRRLHLGDTSPCVSADCVGVTETVGVSAHARILGGLRTSLRSVDPWTCEVEAREPC